ncbi:MAG: DUF2800 domain-containing protein [Shimia sp.]|nr:DUF2800 domain-containing protein [Shimia sp.]
MRKISIAPSSAGVWGPNDGCQGAPAMRAKVPREPFGQAAAEGTAAHAVAEGMILEAAGNYSRRTLGIGEVYKNGVVITREMHDSARIYADDVIGEMRKRSVFTPVVEGKHNITRVHPGQWGYTDCDLYDKKHRSLIVWDYKNGRTPVEVVGNWQLINYVAALLEKYEIDGLEDQRTTVIMRIVQPNAYHRDGIIREWRVMACDLRPQINILAKNAAAAMSGTAPCRTGTHCKWCSARTVCPAAMAAGTALLEMVGDPNPMELTPTQVAAQYELALRAKEHIAGLLTGYTQQMLALAKDGGVPGWSVAHGRGSVGWAIPAEGVQQLGTIAGVDLLKPAAVLTPKQAEEAGVPANLIEMYSKVTPGKLCPQKVDTKELFNG